MYVLVVVFENTSISFTALLLALMLRRASLDNAHMMTLVDLLK